jgi:hypothetical protein
MRTRSPRPVATLALVVLLGLLGAGCSNAPAAGSAERGTPDVPASGSTVRTPDQQQASLEFAQCVRENGVPDFPDPLQGEPLVDTNKIPSTGTDAGMAALDDALPKCADFGKCAGAATSRAGPPPPACRPA